MELFQFQNPHSNGLSLLLQAPDRSAIIRKQPPLFGQDKSRLGLPTDLLRRACLRGRNATPRCLKWRPEGERLLCGLASGEVAAFSGTTLECENLKRILAASGDITSLVPFRLGDILLIGDSWGKIHFSTLNFAPLKVVSIYNQHDAVYAISPSQNEASAVVGVKSTHPVLIDVARYTTVGLFKGLGFETSALVWHPRRNLIAAGARTSQLQLWDSRDVGSSSANSASFAHRGAITSVQWHPTNDFKLLSAGKDQLIFLWDIRYLEKGPFQIHKLADSCPTNFDKTRVSPTAIAWHPFDYGQLFAVADSLGFISFWREEEYVGRVADPQNASVEALEWHPVGSMLVSISSQVNFWSSSINSTYPSDMMEVREPPQLQEVPKPHLDIDAIITAGDTEKE